MSSKAHRAEMRRKYGPDWWKAKAAKTPAVRDVRGRIPTVRWRWTDWPAQIARPDGVTLKAHVRGNTRWTDEDGEVLATEGDLTYEAKVDGIRIVVEVYPDHHSGKWSASTDPGAHGGRAWETTKPKGETRGALIKQIVKAPLLKYNPRKGGGVRSLKKGAPVIATGGQKGLGATAGYFDGGGGEFEGHGDFLFPAIYAFDDPYDTAPWRNLRSPRSEREFLREVESTLRATYAVEGGSDWEGNRTYADLFERDLTKHLAKARKAWGRR